MKRVSFIAIFIFSHIFFIFLQITKHNQQIKLYYDKQKYEVKIKDLTQKKQSLTQKLCNLQKSSEIKKYAQEKLCMSRVGIKQMKKIKKDTDA
jgi:cell division protein FtsB